MLDLTPILKAKGITPIELSRRTGITKSTMYKKIKEQDFKLSEIKKIADQLGYTMEELIKFIE